MKNILLVEDNQTDVELITEALKDSLEGYTLTVASNGEDAIDSLLGSDPLPQLILLDLNLPKLGGLDVLNEIKNDPALRTIPVIVLTNSLAETDVYQAYQRHANAYVRKPLGFDALVEAISATGKFWFDIVTLPDQVVPQQPTPKPA